MRNKKIGIIGGSGLEQLNLFESTEYIKMETPYGEPSSPVLKGQINNTEIYIISRHGFQHSITPTHVNNRANIKAFEQLDCNAIIATTACGSLREEIKPGHLVFPNQIIDFTRFRKNTFFDSFEEGELKHISFADPFDKQLIDQLAAIATKNNIPFHKEMTLVTIEGPRFSSRAESHMFRAWGADIINMSTAPEVILANELNIPYVAVAMSTDYDCWKTDIEAVTVEAVLSTFKKNARNVTGILVDFLRNL